MIATLCAVSLAACVGVEYPVKGTPIKPRSGEALVFSRVHFFDDQGREYFPWGLSPLAPELRLWLLRLGPRRISPELAVSTDGTLNVWLKSGDYALVGNRHPANGSDAEMQDMFVIALLRVPADAVSVYAGDLNLEAQISGVNLAELQTSYEIVRSQVSAASRSSMQKALERQYGPLPGPPVVSPWCAGDEVPGFNDPDLAARGRSLLDGRCASAQ